eukprot:CAMPEP_0174370706 /NCGR_PEP_ID=MMETSP0811_2-20130205/97048_1 /TAXON_ID=73025 ORGANISM="Eutreptiella gymnastica-like, Strain CCMP1594" /NCGR_SAMPLE_ID=MMETSP0811_2 /ASSEMBLY_ACC=CAM_ASM_000667 /LENGTH=75 /DNA_ID=CAMNT_0015516371 /DNA_START=1655 /DNA_END=1878 /DNA_ORIENTATION=+
MTGLEFMGSGTSFRGGRAGAWVPLKPCLQIVPPACDRHMTTVWWALGQGREGNKMWCVPLATGRRVGATMPPTPP